MTKLEKFGLVLGVAAWDTNRLDILVSEQSVEVKDDPLLMSEFSFSFQSLLLWLVRHNELFLDT